MGLFGKGSAATATASSAKDSNAVANVKQFRQGKDVVEVTEHPNGNRWSLCLSSVVDASPAEIYAILTCRQGDRIFRSIKATNYRRMLSEDSARGRRHFEVGHTALIRFLFVNIGFKTKLLIWEDDALRSIRFANKESRGFFTTFDGDWGIQPYGGGGSPQAQHAGGGGGGGGNAHHHGNGHHNAVQQIAGLAAGVWPFHHHPQARRQATLLTLRQEIMPRVRPPLLVREFVQSMLARQAHSLLEDLRAEVERKKEERRCGQQDDAAAAVGGPLLATTRAAVACISPSVHQLQLMWQRYQSQLVLALPAPR